MGERSFRDSGLRIGRIRGIGVWVHWWLLIWLVYILYLDWIRIEEGMGESLLKTLIWWVAMFGTILVHELGHCWMAFRMGGGADAIVLWPLGGLAYCDAPRVPRNQFWVAAGGILFELIPTAAAGLAILVLGITTSIFPSPEVSYLAVFLGAFFWWNLLMIGFNLIPLYPLDGARMLQAILWARMGSHGRAAIATVWASRATYILGFFILLFIGGKAIGMLGFMVLIWAIYETEMLWVRIRSGEEGEESIFGYDFSRGYTSLERTATVERRRSRPSILGRILGRVRERRREREAEIRRRVDELLDKISREGMTSLSPRERRFLEGASRKFRQDD